MWHLSILTSAEAEEAVTQLFERECRQLPSSSTDAETQKTRVSLFLVRKTEITPARIRALRHGLRYIRQCGLDTGWGRISVARVPREDWAESWKRHFKPLEIGTALLIKPSWSPRRPRAGQPMLVLDPGLSFGTGQHPTTRFCLEQIVRHRPGAGRPSFLDLGTGSGILALAAAKLGYAPVEALDADKAAVNIAQANARRNGVSRKAHFRCQDLSHLPLRSARRYDLVCANLTADLLVEQQRRILARVNVGGCLVLAGILHAQFAAVSAAYEAAGLVLAARRREGEWESGSFVRIS